MEKETKGGYKIGTGVKNRILTLVDIEEDFTREPNNHLLTEEEVKFKESFIEYTNYMLRIERRTKKDLFKFAVWINFRDFYDKWGAFGNTGRVFSNRESRLRHVLIQEFQTEGYDVNFIDGYCNDGSPWLVIMRSEDTKRQKDTEDCTIYACLAMCALCELLSMFHK